MPGGTSAIAVIMGVAFSFMWSSAFTSGRIVVLGAPPLTALSIRFLISGLIAVALAAALGQSMRLNRQQWKAVAVFGLCQNVVYLGMNFVAMQWIEASLAAIIASALPLLVALASRLLNGERMALAGVAGLVAGFAGVAIIMGSRISAGSSVLGIFMCAIGVLALCFATMAVRGASSGGNLLMIIGLQLLIGAVILSIPAALVETPRLDYSWQWAAAFLYTTLVPGLIATWVWFTLVNLIGPTRAAAYHFLNPFFGVAVAAILLGEALRVGDMIGVVFIAAGILAVQRFTSEGASSPSK